MVKKKIKNSGLYLLFFMVFIMARKSGFDWPFYVSAALTAIVAIMDIVEVVKRGRE